MLSTKIRNHFLAIFIMVIDVFHLVNSASLRSYKSFEDYDIFSLDEPQGLLDVPYFNKNRDTVFFAFGFGGSRTGNATMRVVKTYCDLDYVNIVLLDWEKEASNELGPIAYPVTGVPNAKKVGKEFGQALVKLFEAGLAIRSVTLLGFSLGAQVMGNTGREVQKTKRNVTRIIALDAAGPIYDGALPVGGLDSSCAEFVVALHTNPGSYGTHEPAGSVDIWANCGSQYQPNCTGNTLGFLSERDLCSHDRSWIYFTEALRNPKAFPATMATSCNNWKAGSSNQTIFFGDNIDPATRGNYYFSTNSEPPFGKGERG